MLTVYFDKEFGWQCWNHGDCVQDVKTQALQDFRKWIKHARTEGDSDWGKMCKQYAEEAKRKYKTVQTMSEKDFDFVHDYFYLSQDPEEITKEQFDYFLNVLPPRKWTKKGFQLSEMYSGTITKEIYKESGKYWIHFVDITKPETWKI